MHSTIKTAANIAVFALIAGLPLALAGLGARVGGAAVWLALFYMTGLAMLADRAIRRIPPAAAPDTGSMAANALSVLLGLGHFVLLALVIPALAGQGGPGPAARLALFLAAGMWFGQVSNSNAHELIHRRAPGLYWLGVAIYTSLLFGHHASAHRKVHHRHVATPRDPNSARRGEGFYRFAPRAWLGSFRAGLAAERGGRGLNPYWVYLGGAAATLLWAGWLAGGRGVAALIALAAYAQMQLLLSDYVQHYGLRRPTGPDGRPVPVSDADSWNAAQWFSGFLMLNAPRHSDHHAHPARPYPSLRLPPPHAAPRLPYSLPVMAAIALVPPLWRRVMARELAKWQRLRQAEA